MTYYDLNMNSKRINNTQDPASAQDVATKNYVDGLAPTPTYLRMTKTTNQDIPNGETVVQFNRIDASANITWDAVTWTGTIITTGYYEVGACSSVAPGGEPNGTRNYSFYVNNSRTNGKGFFFEDHDHLTAPDPRWVGMTLAGGARLIAGDTFQFRITSNSSLNTQTIRANSTTFSIVMVSKG
jgi:hypothetical protein